MEEPISYTNEKLYPQATKNDQQTLCLNIVLKTSRAFIASSYSSWKTRIQICWNHLEGNYIRSIYRMSYFRLDVRFCLYSYRIWNWEELTYAREYQNTWTTCCMFPRRIQWICSASHFGFWSNWWAAKRLLSKD